MKYLIYYLIIINVISFTMCYIDKKKAIKNSERISEKALMLVSLMGGCYFFYIAMYLFHHKTKKIKFKIFIPLMIIIWSIFLMFILKENL